MPSWKNVRLSSRGSRGSHVSGFRFRVSGWRRRMKFELTQEQQLFREMVRGCGPREVAPRAKQVDEEGSFPHETIKKMGELGLMGVAIPPAYGGAGADTVCYVIAMEEIARACASTSVIMTVNNSLVGDLLYRFGSEAQKQRYLVPLAGGHTVACYALSEPGAGSDAGAQPTSRWSLPHAIAIFGPKGSVPSSWRKRHQGSPLQRWRGSWGSRDRVVASSCSKSAACRRRTWWGRWARGSGLPWPPWIA